MKCIKEVSRPSDGARTPPPRATNLSMVKAACNKNIENEFTSYILDRNT